MQLSNQMTVTPLTTLKSHETREDLVKWWGLAKCQLKNSKYRDVMYFLHSEKILQIATIIDVLNFWPKLNHAGFIVLKMKMCFISVIIF